MQIDGAVALLDSTGTVLLEVDDPNSLSSTNRVVFVIDAESPHSPGEGLVYRVRSSGTYYAQVRIGLLATENQDGAGDYLLSISRNCVQGGSGLHGAPRFESITEWPDGTVQLPLIILQLLNMQGDMMRYLLPLFLERRG